VAKDSPQLGHCFVNRALTIEVPLEMSDLPTRPIGRECRTVRVLRLASFLEQGGQFSTELVLHQGGLDQHAKRIH
jgi:hypothetical protein